MSPGRKRRFHIPDDNLEAKRVREEEALAECAGLDLDDSPDIVQKTKDRREAYMQEWRDFFVDPDGVWLGLCRHDGAAKRRCVAFLRNYVKKSEQEFPVLVPLEETGMDGTKETEWRRTVTSAHTLLNVWRSLIAQADSTVLLKKRREDPANKHTWRLKFMDHTNRQGQGPVYEISKWIFKEGATELGLCVDLLVEKIEAPAEDVIAIANIVWERPDLTPCAPIVRLSFLAELMLRGIGGFRSKALRNFKYKQVQLSIVRNRKGRSETEIAATFRVPIVKERQTSRGKKPKWITFTVFFIPAPGICLASFVTALAIKADAFDPSIDSVDTLLQRPNLEETDYLPLKWKKEIEDDVVFRIDDPTFSRIWHQSCLALGLRVDPRPYVLRVGVGMDLDGVLADVLRNYIMQNTSAVFEKSYQAEHIRVNPLRLRFMPVYPDEEEGWHSEPLERAMRTMILKSDPNAPVEPSAEYLQSFERRRDVSDLHRDIEEAKAAKDRKPLYRKLKGLIENLSRQAVGKMRTEYFERVDRLRALGQSTSEEAASAGAAASQAKHVRLCHGGEALEQVARYIRLHNDIAEDENERRKTPYNKNWYLELLVGYLTNQPAVAKMEKEHDEQEAMVYEVPGAARPSQDEVKHTCLLCRESFTRVDALTEHCKNLHVQKGAFDRSFPCPECRRRGNPDDHFITSPSTWSSHVEMFHGCSNAPKLRTEPQPAAYETKLCCPFCGLYVQLRGFGKHRSSHVRDGAASTIFSSPFPCLACRNDSQGGDGKQDVMIDGCSAWDAHVSFAHPDEEDWFVEGPPEPSGPSMGDEKPVCLLCDDRRPCTSQDALTRHCKTVHAESGKKFDKPFPCPECRRCGMPDRLITTPSSWSRHVAMVHGRQNMPKLRTALAPKPTLDETKQDAYLSLAHSDVQRNQPVEVPSAASESNNKQPVCLLCDDRRPFSTKSNLTSHCKTAHVENGRFRRPFPCPECRRCGKPDHLIAGPSSWSSHVEMAHGRANAPTLRTDQPAPQKTMLCPFCGLYVPPKGSGKHRSGHIREGAASAIFSSPFPCLACRNGSPGGAGGNQDVMIDGCSAWNAHVFSTHGENSRTWTVGIMPVGVKRKGEPEGGNTKREIQCLLCDGFFPLRGIWTHFMRTHLPVLTSGSALCLDCNGRHQRDQEPTSRIAGIDAWNEHLQSTHCNLFWYFTASRSSFAVAEPSPGTQTNIVGGGKRRKIGGTGVGAVAPGGYSVSSISPIGRSGEWQEVPGDDFSDDIRTPPPCEQPSIDLSIADPTLSGPNGMTLRHVSTTPESLDEPHTPAPWGGTDLNLIDPLLLDEGDRERMKVE